MPTGQSTSESEGRPIFGGPTTTDILGLRFHFLGPAKPVTAHASGSPLPAFSWHLQFAVVSRSVLFTSWKYALIFSIILVGREECIVSDTTTRGVEFV